MRFFCSSASIGKLFSFCRESFLALSAEGHAGDTRVHYGASVSPGGVPWHLLWAFTVAGAGSFRGIAFRRARAKQDDGNPHKKKNDQQVFACSAVFNSSHPERGRLATSHLGLPRVQQQSRFELVSDVPRCLCMCASTCIQGLETEKSLATAVQLVLLREHCCGSIY